MDFLVAGLFLLIILPILIFFLIFSILEGVNKWTSVLGSRKVRLLISFVIYIIIAIFYNFKASSYTTDNIINDFSKGTIDLSNLFMKIILWPFFFFFLKKLG